MKIQFYHTQNSIFAIIVELFFSLLLMLAQRQYLGIDGKWNIFEMVLQNPTISLFELIFYLNFCFEPLRATLAVGCHFLFLANFVLLMHFSFPEVLCWAEISPKKLFMGLHWLLCCFFIQSFLLGCNFTRLLPNFSLCS
jgi:hypothetical protein